MDITWNSAFSPVRDKPVATGPADYSDMLIQDPTSLDGQPVGALGDQIAAYIQVKGR